MTRRTYIELIRRQIYNSFPADDATITVGLVNKWLDLGIAAAAQKYYTDNQKIEGISYINNSFYTTFKNLSISNDGNGIWKVTLPQIPLGLGANDSISSFTLKDSAGLISYPVVWLTANQQSIHRGMRKIPNKVLAYINGKNVYILSDYFLDGLTASVIMVSGGDNSDLDSEINVPDDYLIAVTEYVKAQLQFERMQPVDTSPGDGQDFVKTV